jgi:ammonia channel protein AmtB
MVRKMNVLATMAQSLAAVTLISILWVAFGYSLCFVGDGPWLGTLVGLFVPLRVSREHELEGLDISQHGEALQ